MAEEFVIYETRRPLAWYYDAETQEYIRREDDGKVHNTIFGHHLPDPHILTDKLQKASTMGANHTGRTHADPVTYALWNHWIEVNAKLNTHV